MLYTDGACTPNPGRGGWAAILEFMGTEKELVGGCLMTTNNRMELLSVIEGLEHLTRPCIVTVVSDSKYVVDGISKRWVYNWMKKPNFGGKKNPDLWKRLVKAVERHDITWVHIKGHAGHEYNERCDRLAVAQYAPENILEEDLGYVPN